MLLSGHTAIKYIVTVTEFVCVEHHHALADSPVTGPVEYVASIL